MNLVFGKKKNAESWPVKIDIQNASILVIITKLIRIDEEIQTKTGGVESWENNLNR